MKQFFTIKVFERCRIFKMILNIIDLILGITLAFQIPELKDAVCMTDSTNNRYLIFYCFLSCIFIVILLVIILLNCIIKDAQEDIGLVQKSNENIK